MYLRQCIELSSALKKGDMLIFAGLLSDLSASIGIHLHASSMLLTEGSTTVS